MAEGDAVNERAVGGVEADGFAAQAQLEARVQVCAAVAALTGFTVGPHQEIAARWDDRAVWNRPAVGDSQVIRQGETR